MNILNKIIRSSEDPKKYSLFLQGLVLLVGGQGVKAFALACSIGLVCVGVDQEWVNEVAGAVEMIVYAALSLVGGAWALYGLFRKLALSRWSHPNA
ncbi:hypothetical protein KW797_04355 [Candidatus Parcubacteria bacterium]|nr:hypothetical protein [Candidatus Parcubacteria bacterium]